METPESRARRSSKPTRRSTNGGSNGNGKPKAAASTPLVSNARVETVLSAGELLAVLRAFKKGDFSARLPLAHTGVAGEIAIAFNDCIEVAGRMATEVARVSTVVGKEGRLGHRAVGSDLGGTWMSCIESVNGLVEDLVQPMTEVGRVIGAVASGDLSQRMTLENDRRMLRGEFLRTAKVVNGMVEQLGSFAAEVTRVAREVGTEGKLGGQAEVKGVAGTWKDLTDNVNSMASNLTAQVRNIAEVTTAVARGDLTKKITVDVKGEILELKNTINTMADQLNAFASEVTRVAREVGTEGKLGGQTKVEGVAGTWKDLTDSVNSMASNLTAQVRNIADVTTAVAKGDLSKKITVAVRGEILELKQTINTMVDQLNAFASEVTRVAREVGTEGKLGGQAQVSGVAGTWKDLTDSVNSMASNLTAQVRNIADVTTAVAYGDLSRKITVDVKGEILQLKDTINTMVDQLNAFASEVTRVAREVGTEGKLGGQAQVKGVAGTWKDLTDNVNSMATNLTNQVRGIAEVVAAVANGELTRKLALEARGEIAQLADTINGMTGTLAIFAEQVTSVAREVGVEGKLGGQARVPGAAGTWRALTDNVNQLAGNLTTQVRAIGEVATAVTKGDLTRSITVEAREEVAALKDVINEMIRNLRDTTQKTTEQDWLKTNLAKFTRMLQGQRDLVSVARQILSELAPLVGAQHGVFYLAEPDKDNGEVVLKLLASYAYRERKSVSSRYRLGEGVVGQCAFEKEKILLRSVPGDYIRIGSGLGEAPPLSIIVLPVLFEDKVNAVIELASFDAFSDIHQVFLDQLTESIGIVVNTIAASMRTEKLLQQSQSLTQELQTQQEELRETNERLERQAASLGESEERLRQQQEELRTTNEQLEEKATLLELKNREVELAKEELEEKAEQLSLTSRYKSEFLANMSHELRTPLNSLLILSRMLSENAEGNLQTKQVDFAKTIHAAGADLLTLIDDILDLSKIESGTMAVDATDVHLADVRATIELGFRHVAHQKGLAFDLFLGNDLPPMVRTDAKRLQQVLKNLLSNAFKFTDEGHVTLSIIVARDGWSRDHERLQQADVVLAFAVTDTGIGIPKDKQRIIFEAFQQADGTTSRRYGGTGLGLSISREIARLLGGELKVVSEPGEGSTFTLYLPRSYVTPQPLLGRRHEGRALMAPRELANGQLTTVVSSPSPAFADDRDELRPGDRVVLIAGQDAAMQHLLLEAARADGFRGVLAAHGDGTLDLVTRLKPSSLLLDSGLAEPDGWVVLDQLKHDPALQHIPVVVLVDGPGARRALRWGACATLSRPVTSEAAKERLQQIRELLDGPRRLVLVVDEDHELLEPVIELLGGAEVDLTMVGTSTAALTALGEGDVRCLAIVGDPEDTSMLELVQKARRADYHGPVVVYADRSPTPSEARELSRLSEAPASDGEAHPVVWTTESTRLFDETALRLHRPVAGLSVLQRQALDQVRRAEAALEGRKILVVDDDVRNIYAVTSFLERHHATVFHAENGQEGLDLLDRNPDMDAVLMDIMMPEMDGFEVMERIRADERWADLPIVAVTAKAMRADREKCLRAGATEYVAKPVDLGRLLSLLRVRLSA